MTRRLAEWGASEKHFGDTLVEKSEGNFLYLVHVLRDIESGSLTADTIDDVSKLPKGLRQYYSTHWRTMSAQERFDELYKPVVCQLATVREPVSINYLQELTRLSVSDIQHVVNAWREFLNKLTSPRAEPAYRVYHASFRDFLKDEIGLTAYHGRISDNALLKFRRWLGMS